MNKLVEIWAFENDHDMIIGITIFSKLSRSSHLCQRCLLFESETYWTLIQNSLERRLLIRFHFSDPFIEILAFGYNLNFEVQHKSVFLV